MSLSRLLVEQLTLKGLSQTYCLFYIKVRWRLRSSPFQHLDRNEPLKRIKTCAKLVSCFDGVLVLLMLWRMRSRSSCVSLILHCSIISFCSYCCLSVCRRRWLFSSSSISFCLIAISQVMLARSAWKFSVEHTQSHFLTKMEKSAVRCHFYCILHFCVNYYILKVSAFSFKMKWNQNKRSYCHIIGVILLWWKDLVYKKVFLS